jgi:hypothetical protein
VPNYEQARRREKIPKGDLIADLRRVARELGTATVTARTYAEKGAFGKTTFLRRFGAWNAALQAAGLEVDRTLNNADEVLLANLGQVWRHLGRQPLGCEMDKRLGVSRFSLSTYEKRFGAWNEAISAFVHFTREQQQVPGSRPTSKDTTAGRNPTASIEAAGKSPHA